jgi:hypothetical protein
MEAMEHPQGRRPRVTSQILIESRIDRDESRSSVSRFLFSLSARPREQP